MIMWQFAARSRLPYFCGKISGYVVIYRSKDKNTTQGNLAELVGSPVAPTWCKYLYFLGSVCSLCITITLRNCNAQSIGQIDSIFKELFGVGVYERTLDGKLLVYKITYGVEPNGYEIYDFVLKNYYWLRFSLTITPDAKETSRNPKWVHRKVWK